jgi:hypothetical protein
MSQLTSTMTVTEIQSAISKKNASVVAQMIHESLTNVAQPVTEVQHQAGITSDAGEPLGFYRPGSGVSEVAYQKALTMLNDPVWQARITITERKHEGKTSHVLKLGSQLIGFINGANINTIIAFENGTAILSDFAPLTEQSLEAAMAAWS